MDMDLSTDRHGKLALKTPEDGTERNFTGKTGLKTPYISTKFRDWMEKKRDRSIIYFVIAALVICSIGGCFCYEKGYKKGQVNGYIAGQELWFVMLPGWRVEVVFEEVREINPAVAGELKKLHDIWERKLRLDAKYESKRKLPGQDYMGK